jgi:hypothetical protein
MVIIRVNNVILYNLGEFNLEEMGIGESFFWKNLDNRARDEIYPLKISFSMRYWMAFNLINYIMKMVV